MGTAINRHLKVNGYRYSILRDREFEESRRVLEGKANGLLGFGFIYPFRSNKKCFLVILLFDC